MPCHPQVSGHMPVSAAGQTAHKRIPTQVEEYADEVFDLLDNGAHIYFCGLKGMMPGIQDMLERVAGEKGCAP